MGVRKFRSVEDMPGPPPRPPLDPENLRIALGLAGLVSGLRRSRHPPGVRRFRSWDDALLHRDRVASGEPKATAPRIGSEGPGA